MKRIFKILPLLLVASLTACNKTGAGYYFYTEISYALYSNKSEVVDEIKSICKVIDKISDPYEKRDITGVYNLNQTNEEIEVSEELYNLLDASKEASTKAINFNPLVGSLSDKWKASLGKDNPEPLSNEVIQQELIKITSSSIATRKGENKYYAQRIGEAQIDLGGIAKGYALDRIYEALNKYSVTDYIINCGSSSILLGTNKHAQTDNYTVGLRDVPGLSFKAKECVISSSGNDIQGVKIGDITYSHIINPNNGSAIMENDAVIVITNPSTGYLGDALSTSLMMNTVEEIKEKEKALNAKTIVVKNKQVVYSHPDIELIK